MHLKPLIYALPLLVITSFPQIYLCFQRGADWNKTFAYFDTDESTYGAYVNALREGRPRRNDPYTGEDSQFETLYSIQFVPAYAIALAARVFHISTATAFITLIPIITFASYLSIYALLVSLTERPWLSAVGAFTTLCFGGYFALPPWEALGIPRYCFPFLRRYEPAIAFPVFFLLTLCVWKALTSKGKKWGVFAGVCFSVLIFSYFYLWTAAAAWLFILFILWLRRDRRDALRVFGTIIVFGIFTWIPYAWLLSKRVIATDQADLIELTRVPDLFRGPEIYAMLFLWFFRKNLSNEKLFAFSFALATFILFNQQIVTGRSLQPFHYEQFIANYWIVMIGFVLVRRARASKRFVVTSTLASIVFGLWLAGIFAVRIFPAYREADEAAAPISKLSKGGTVFAPNRSVTTTIPLHSTNAVVWSRYTYTYSPLPFAEQRKRLFKWLYYCGVTDEGFREMLKDKTSQLDVFGYRASEHLTRYVSPITQSEIDQAVSEYKFLIDHFDGNDARNPEISFAILTQKDDTTRLDRWYQRDAGTHAGAFVVYRLVLR